MRSIDSDEFRIAESIALREISEMAITAVGDKDTDITKVERQAALRKIQIRSMVALVAGWSFDEGFTPENVTLFLTEAPQIVDQINKISGNRSLFLKKKSPISTPGSKKRSSSTGKSKEAN